MKKLSHIDAQGAAAMVDVSAKPVVLREALARGEIIVSEETLRLVESNQIAKGNVLATARIAGIAAAAAEGPSVLHGIHHLERGYDQPLVWNDQARGMERVTRTVFWQRSVSLLWLDFGRSDAQSAVDIGREIRQRMLDEYNYDTGPYQDYINETNNNKFLGKLDWNIGTGSNLSFRYAMLDAKRDLGPHGFVLSYNNSGRGPNQSSLPFRNSGYTINNDLHSLTCVNCACASGCRGAASRR